MPNIDDVTNEAQNMSFEDASAASAQMFEQPETQEDTPVEETPVEETPATEQPNEQQAVTEEAVQTAEVAAGVANQTNQELQAALAQSQQLAAENARLTAQIQQMSSQQEESIVDEVMEMPVLDLSSLAFDDEATIRQKQADYAQKMAQYTEKKVMGKIAPFVKQAEQSIAEQQKSEVITSLSDVPQLAGIADMVPQLDKIIANSTALSSPNVPFEEKYIEAYAIAKYVNSLNEPAPVQSEATAEELLEHYKNNQEFQDLVEKSRVEKVAGSQQVPTFSASSGAVNAALNIKEKPKTFEEASRRTQEMFGM